MSTPEGVVLDCTPEEAQEFHIQRQEADAIVSGYELPDLSDDPAEIYQYLRAIERGLIPDDDYEKGSAKKDNDLFIIRDNGGVLLTAEHATVQQRKQADGTTSAKEEDSGTGALVVVTARETSSDGLVAVGQQTGDANNDEQHPFKELIGRIIIQSEDIAHLSIHGMKRAHAAKPRDTRGFSVQLGIGGSPSEATLALKDYLVEIGEQHDLRVGVNAPHIRFGSKTGKVLLYEDGSVKTVAFSAANSNTTRAYAQAVAESLGRSDSFAAIQIELSDVLRSHPEALVSFPSQRDRELGAYLGYLFVRKAVESVDKL